MRNITHSILVLALFSATSCSKKSESTTTAPPAPLAGPWDGTYKMVSVNTSFADTSDYIPYGGNERRVYAGTRSDSATAGTVVITRDKISQNGILIYRTEVIQQSTYYKNTNQTTSSTNTSAGPVSPNNPSNIQSTYSIAGADSVSIAEPGVLPLPFGTYPANPKFRYTFDGTTLTIYNDYYTKKKVTAGVDNYDLKSRNQSVAVYRKQ